ncbi:MAG: efflux RND transporter periplasmic adaptor subunit [Myxococcota bacterium]
MSDAVTPATESFTRRAATRARANPVALGLGLLFLLLLVAGVVPRVRARLELQREGEVLANARPRVAVSAPQPAPPSDLNLPGSTLPFQQATLYARVSGYLERRLVDIGDEVKAGQLLAVISAPELDQQLAQAQADLARAKADLEFARSSLLRFEDADKDGAVAKEDLDQRRNAVHTAEANVHAAAATVQGLTEQQRFERVTAPFAGRVTQRNVDVGALITSGSGSTMTPLFTLAQNDVLRVYVNVPQPFVDELQVGQAVQVRSLPNKPFRGTVARSAGSLDPGTRTMLTEIDIPNPDGLLKPGMYVQVAFEATRVGPRWRVPAGAVMFDAQGTRLGIVDADDTLHYRPVVLGRDFGGEIEVASGINGDERVVTTPSAALADGQRVEAVAPPPP